MLRKLSPPSKRERLILMPAASPTSSFQLLFSELDKSGIRWAVWKGLSEINDGLSSRGDIDVLCAQDDEADVRQLLSDLGWFQADWKRKPSRRVVHFFQYEGDSGFFHLHLYFGITTGESGLKEYVFPFTDSVLETRVFDSALGVWVAHSGVLKQLFVLRHFLKGGSILSRLVYKRELEAYRREWALLRVRADDQSLVNLFEILGIPPLVIDDDRLIMPRFSQSFRIRNSLRRYLRFPVWSLPFIRVSEFSRIAARRIRRSRGRFLFPGGLVLAFIGPDGSGKSSQISAVKEIFMKDFLVSTFHLGKPWRPLGKIVSRLPQSKLFSRSRTLAVPRVAKLEVRGIAAPAAIKALLLAVSRVIVSKIAVRVAQRGTLVLSDRWAAITGQIDAPRLPDFEQASPLFRGLSRIEMSLYEKIPTADVAIFLNVSIEKVLDRVQARDGNTEQIIWMAEKRYEQSAGIQTVSKKRVSISNDGSPVVATRNAIRLIEKELSLLSHVE